MVSEWCFFKERERKDLIAVFNKFNKQEDGVLNFSAFENMVHDLEPELSTKQILQLFKMAHEMEMDDNYRDKLSD